MVAAMSHRQWAQLLRLSQFVDYFRGRQEAFAVGRYFVECMR